MKQQRISGQRGFSLIELVIVVVIIGIISAIAIPRMSRGAKGAAESSVRQNLAVMRNGIDLYAAEHGGNFPTTANFILQMTRYSNSSGTAQDTKDTTHIYGPYIRSIPPLSLNGVGAGAGSKGDTGVAAAAAAGIAWVFDQTTGSLTVNTGTATDDEGALYSSY